MKKIFLFLTAVLISVNLFGQLEIRKIQGTCAGDTFKYKLYQTGTTSVIPLGSAFKWLDNNGNESTLDSFLISTSSSDVYITASIVDAANNTLISSISNNPYITNLTSVGINSYSNSTFKMYPNPCSTSLTVETTLGAPYQILDITGRLVLHGTISGSIDVQNLPAGTYIFRVEEKSLKFFKY